jgi:opacity protein-like surface antigen
MKRLVLLAAILSVVSAPCFAEFGLGVKLGAGQNDPKTMKEAFDTLTMFNRTLTRSPGIFAIEGLYEHALDSANGQNKLGFKFGVDFYGENKLEVAGFEARETTYSFPLSVYYKYEPGIKKISVYGGAGLTIMNSKIDGRLVGILFPEDSYSKTKVFPHITAGAEYRFTKLFALGLDLKYNIGAKIEKDGSVMSDRSGINGALAGRFYF